MNEVTLVAVENKPGSDVSTVIVETNDWNARVTGTDAQESLERLLDAKHAEGHIIGLRLSADIWEMFRYVQGISIKPPGGELIYLLLDKPK